MSSIHFILSFWYLLSLNALYFHQNTCFSYITPLSLTTIRSWARCVDFDNRSKLGRELCCWKQICTILIKVVQGFKSKLSLINLHAYLKCNTISGVTSNWFPISLGFLRAQMEAIQFRSGSLLSSFNISIWRWTALILFAKQRHLVLVWMRKSIVSAVF